MPFLQPEKTIAAFEILPGMRVADFGSGAGHWAVALAKAVGPSGAVFAIDVQESALEAVLSLARQHTVQIIEPVHANLETPGATKLKDGTVDRVLLSTILFQVDEKEPVLAEAFRITKIGGKCIVIEWDAAGSMAGPPQSQRINRQEAERLATVAGFQFEKEFHAGSYHYGLVFRKI